MLTLSSTPWTNGKVGHTCLITDAVLAFPSSSSSKPQHPSRRVPINASVRHAGWKTKISLLVTFDAYTLRRTAIVAVIRAARKIGFDTTYQSHDHTIFVSIHMDIPRGMENVARTERYLDDLLSIPARLVDWSLVSWSVAITDPTQVAFKRYGINLLHSVSTDL